jgi:phosphoribosylaminoimidazolecarboxamide formyltransferase/IMP cyclohydrolase
VPRIRRALISVSDKRGLLEFARALRALGVEILSTGGTAAALRNGGVDVLNVSDVTGFPEILDGRVKTLHPKIYGALLAVEDNPEHVRQTSQLGIASIDLVVVNLYPFGTTVARRDVSVAEVVEQIDIGGPSMLRAAAKNYRHKAAVTDPERYPSLIEELKSRNGELSEETCAALACEVFRHTATYDAAIAGYFATSIAGEGFPPSMITMAAPREARLRYGENPHQQAGLYGNFMSLFQTLHGKELSFNNIVDIAAAAEIVAEFDDPTVAIIKHTNPCGVGSAPTLTEAYGIALQTDATSAFGGIVAVNRPLDMATADRINAIFTEVVIAPVVPPEVLEFLRRKKDRRIVELHGDLRQVREPSIRSVPGGYLLQEADAIGEKTEEWRVVTNRRPSDDEKAAMEFAWRVAKHVKSNAIVYAQRNRTLGIGAGQMSRVDSARIAAEKARNAGLDLRGSAAASDAYFPFADGLLETVRAGATCVVQPGGSVRDPEVIKAADDHHIAMMFTGKRHFRH